MIERCNENISIYVRIRRWWKSYKQEVAWKGYIIPLLEDFMPGYFSLNRLYWAIRHRTTDIFHKIDTGLEPGYYDIEDLMIHGIFSLLCSYIEIEHKGKTNVIARIDELMKYFAEDGDNSFKQQADELRKVLNLYNWWKDIYPNYDDNDPWTIYCNSMPEKHVYFKSTPCEFDKDGDPTMYELNSTSNDSAEEKLAIDKALRKSHIYNDKINKEIEDNMIKLIKLRNTLWT